MKFHLRSQNAMFQVFFFFSVFTRNKSEMEHKLRNFDTSRLRVPYVRILLVGEVGSGKSSFVNSVNNTFQGRITSEALVAKGSGKSFTKSVSI